MLSSRPLVGQRDPAIEPKTTESGLVGVASRLRRALGGCRFTPPVAHVYNPLEYAWEPHRRYLERYGTGKPAALLLGMNPGPWGMAQTGVPFGDVEMVRGWLGIEGRVGHPRDEHPKRPITGFECHRSEVSGRRLWGWASSRFGTPRRFFGRFFVWNYCPLIFLEASGRNRTPDKLSRSEQAPLFASCDAALREVLGELGATAVIGVGRFAAGRARAALADSGCRVGYVTHPSPANPQANRGWAAQLDRAIEDLQLTVD